MEWNGMEWNGMEWNRMNFWLRLMILTVHCPSFPYTVSWVFFSSASHSHTSVCLELVG
jgi:hypothetical protein